MTSSAFESERNLKLKTVSTPKRRRRNDDYVTYGLHGVREEQHNHYPFANCLFCSVKYANSNLVSFKHELHLKKQHLEQQFKSKKFFESQLSALHTKRDGHDLDFQDYFILVI